MGVVVIHHHDQGAAGPAGVHEVDATLCAQRGAGQVLVGQGDVDRPQVGRDRMRLQVGAIHRMSLGRMSSSDTAVDAVVYSAVDCRCDYHGQDH